ncbi:MAG: beta-lactamase family protein [Proteobacteria bacterium]|nr:beta-lactamase family protein [Pseudomonadota bacterium]
MKIKNDITEFLFQGVLADVFSGAQAAWYLHSERQLTSAYAGTVQSEQRPNIDSRTVFDIASITKVFTASAVLRLVDRGELELETRLDNYLPQLKGRLQGSATLAELLAHEAGYEDWLPLFSQVPVNERGSASAKKTIVESVLAARRSCRFGEEAIYSDLGFIALMHLIEKVTRSPLDTVVAREVTEPLKLESVHFRPVQQPYPVTNEDYGRDIAATENCPWRGRVLIGEVHDDNAWAMGGISGHAGLFATAEDLALMGAAWLEALSGGKWLKKETASQAVCGRPLGRCLGWDVVSPTKSSAGTRFGARSFGHLGFTGCCLWVDPDRGLSVALNTNRVHFGREKTAIRSFRPAFHDHLLELLGDD